MNSGHRFNLIRRSIPQPELGEQLLDGGDEFRRWFGGDHPWGSALPSVYRLLANPASPQVIPKRPSPGSKLHEALSYWSALLHLLIYPFGWSRPDRGLRWWYESGFAVDDPVLALIDQVWRRDGQLDWFAAWLWSSGGLLPDHHPFTQLANFEIDTDPIEVDAAWVDETTREATRAGVEHPLHGGNDGFHLSMHLDGPVHQGDGPPVLLHSVSGGRGTLFVPAATGWYRALAELEQLTHGKTPGQLDVVVKPIGHVGTYERSQVTGLWYTGEHETHLRGV